MLCIIVQSMYNLCFTTSSLIELDLQVLEDAARQAKHSDSNPGRSFSIFRAPTAEMTVEYSSNANYDDEEVPWDDAEVVLKSSLLRGRQGNREKTR